VFVAVLKLLRCQDAFHIFGYFLRLI
jgi:hypothetical protein